MPVQDHLGHEDRVRVVESLALEQRLAHIAVSDPLGDENQRGGVCDCLVDFDYVVGFALFEFLQVLGQLKMEAFEDFYGHLQVGLFLGRLVDLVAASREVGFLGLVAVVLQQGAGYAFGCHLIKILL